MRKVSDVEGLDFPYTFIEAQEDGVIVDIPTSYAIMVASLNEDGTERSESVVVGYDNEGNEIIEEQIIMEQSTVDVVPTLYGEEASWEDVLNLGYFDLIIGEYKYSRTRKDGFKHFGMKDNKIGLVQYRGVTANGKELGKTKKVVIPKLVSSPALEIVDGYISINGLSYEDTIFYDISTRCNSTLGEIKRIAPDGSIYNIICKVKEDVEEFI